MKFIYTSLITFILFCSCCSNSNLSKEREKQIVDSVTHYITNKVTQDSAKARKIEELKTQLKQLEVSTSNVDIIKKADVVSLKEIKFDYDYDQKLFNKKSDIDGHIFNHSKSVTYKNFVFKIVGKDKYGNITKTFANTVPIKLLPQNSSKFTIRFVDPDNTKEATIALIGAETD